MFSYNFRKHRELVDGNFDNNAKSKQYKRERAHADEVCQWFRDEIRRK